MKKIIVNLKEGMIYVHITFHTIHLIMIYLQCVPKNQLKDFYETM